MTKIFNLGVTVNDNDIRWIDEKVAEHILIDHDDAHCNCSLWILEEYGLSMICPHPAFSFDSGNHYYIISDMETFIRRKMETEF